MGIKVTDWACLLGVTASGVGMLLGTVVGANTLAILCSRILGLCFAGWLICLLFSMGSNPWDYDLSSFTQDPPEQ
jgi:hypothetical protein